MDAKDRYLRRKYGITLDEYKSMLAAQKDVCAICGNPPVNLALAVDHDHKVNRLRITSTKWTTDYLANLRDPLEQPVRMAMAYYGLTGTGKNANAAKRDLRAKLKRASVRGLLCTNCNPGLRKFSDDPQRLANAAEYLRRHQNG